MLSAMDSQVAVALIGAVSGIICALIGAVAAVKVKSISIKNTVRGEGNATTGSGDATVTR